MDPHNEIVIIGGGLAGCECALALARHGIACTVYEQKPGAFSPAHTSPDLAELVCSNSFRSDDASGSGVGLLKQEMRELGSAVMEAASRCSVPAGKALAVDRTEFSRILTERMEGEPLVTLIRRQIPGLDAPELQGRTVVIAAGPLASEGLASSLAAAISGDGAERLYFYDAIAPIVRADSVDMGIAFRGSRYGNDAPPPYSDDAPFLEKPVETMTQPSESDGDYLNCPMTKAEYTAFYEALLAAERVPAHDFEKEIHFEGCMPIEALADRGDRTLTFGPLKPVGFTDPRTGRRPYALLQLRAENRERTSFNLVGCQTKMTYAAQDRVVRLIPGLAGAACLRFGSVPRNTYVNAPECLESDLSLKGRPGTFLAGQITGVEGYVESAACGLWLGLMLAGRILGQELPLPPVTTALGALLNHLRTPSKHFTPSNIHFGLMPELDHPTKKKSRKAEMADRGRADFASWMEGCPLLARGE
ncbi:MAG: methylenetetrahydrofolate--tRNA-(uracil(54)-C(5))-methyltransferase (FADH(2)-oxidizing) TrmFO [Mailhella sp.]|nr:methylenetetrahydrofolate--tRNA-(uracil(54)-C(5))-methyltransferase (FADH(2)-oxidizing) TrmFO [Mailhella sp.]